MEPDELLLEAGTLTADLDTRSVTGLLLPYGEEGRSNLGRVKVKPHAVTIPRDHSAMVANLDHDRTNPVAVFTNVIDTDAGAVASFRIAATPEGDELLADLASAAPKRRKLSAEVAGIVIRAGEIIAGRLFGAAFVENGAFPSAALMAEDVGEATAEPQEKEGTTMEHDENNPQCGCAACVAGRQEAPAPAAEAAAAAAPAEPAAAAAAPVPALMASAPKGQPIQPRLEVKPRGNTLQQVAYALAGYFASGDKHYLDAIEPSERDGSTLFAALNDIKISGASQVGTNITVPQWLGKVWADRTFIQRFVPLMTPQTLTSLDVKGWDWNTKPKGGTWSGNKANVPSNQFTTSPITGTANRWAMGHDHAREFVDFPQPGYWESYFQAGADDFAEWEDDLALAAIVGGATAGAIEVGDAPATWDGSDGTMYLVDGALALIARGIVPEYAVMGSDLYRGELLQNDNKVIETLSLSLKLDEGQLENFRIIPAPSVRYDGSTPTGMDGVVIVGAKGAMSHFRLPESPIRTRALDQVKGGVDDAMFGYTLDLVNKAAGLQMVTEQAGA
jgi:hypothetical protein